MTLFFSLFFSFFHLNKVYALFLKEKNNIKQQLYCRWDGFTKWLSGSLES